MNFRYVNGYMFREDYETVIEAQQFLNKLEVIIPHSGGWYIGKEEYVNAVPLGAGEDAAQMLFQLCWATNIIQKYLADCSIICEKQELEKNKMTEQKSIALLQKMITTPEEELNAMADTGMFNSIIAGYLVATLKSLDYKAEDIQAAARELHRIFDEMDASAARKELYNA